MIPTSSVPQRALEGKEAEDMARVMVAAGLGTAAEVAQDAQATQRQIGLALVGTVPGLLRPRSRMRAYLGYQMRVQQPAKAGTLLARLRTCCHCGEACGPQAWEREWCAGCGDAVCDGCATRVGRREAYCRSCAAQEAECGRCGASDDLGEMRRCAGCGRLTCRHCGEYRLSGWRCWGCLS